MNDATSEIRTILASIHGGSILVPGSVVAEVVDYSEPIPVKEAPAWLLGEVGWNDWSVPVLSFAALAGTCESEVADKQSRILVIKSLADSSLAPYLGVLISGVPRMKKVTADSLTQPKQVKDHPAVFRAVTFAEERVMIPDLDSVNKLVAEALSLQDRDKG